jgi:hypothetical protein
MTLNALRRFSPVVLLLPLLAAQPQQTRPIVTDAATGIPIPYASVGVQNKPIGTVADGLGHFAAEPLATAARTDTLVVSCVGYQPSKLLVRDLSGLREVKLRPQVQALQEVRVRAAGWKRHTIGRDGAWGITFYNFHLASDKDPARKLGREVGTILHVKPESFVEDAHVYIGSNTFQNLGFRLNVRALDAEDHPATSLLTQDVQFAVAAGATGWQHIDLKPYGVNVGQQERIAITIEWLDGIPTEKKDWYSLTVPAALSATHRMVFRDKSEDAWKVQPVNLSLYVTARSPKG